MILSDTRLVYTVSHVQPTMQIASPYTHQSLYQPLYLKLTDLYAPRSVAAPAIYPNISIGDSFLKYGILDLAILYRGFLVSTSKSMVKLIFSLSEIYT